MTNAVLSALIERVKSEALAYEDANRADSTVAGGAPAQTGGGTYMPDVASQSVLDRLMTVDSARFVDTAYRLLLRRGADDAGRATYEGQLASGASRLVVVAKLRMSGEGRRVGTSLKGFRLPIALAAADKMMRRVGLSRPMSAVLRRLDTRIAERAMVRSLVEWRRHFESVAGAVQRHDAKIPDLSRHVERLDELVSPVPPVPPQVIDAYYLAFEDANRGSRQQVLDKLAIYEDWLKTNVPAQRGLTHDVVDIGCGRGEWLNFVADRGKVPFGIDINQEMVDTCIAHGYKARKTDALTFLRSLPSGSVAAVTGFHIIEHLPFDYLFALVQESFRVLTEGGSVLFETPNPENVLVGSHTFYHDFTHRNPVTPTAISFLLKHHGFDEIEIVRSSPYPDEARVPGNDPLTERVNGHLCGPQDYAVMGRKHRPGKGKDQGKAQGKGESA
jgi:SAM-dependent methyltransferase